MYNVEKNLAFERNSYKLSELLNRDTETVLQCRQHKNLEFSGLSELDVSSLISSDSRNSVKMNDDVTKLQSNLNENRRTWKGGVFVPFCYFTLLRINPMNTRARVILPFQSRNS